VPFIESGQIAATIHQRAWTQGRIAFHMLHRLLVDNIAPEAPVRLSPNIVMKTNVKLFIERLRSGAVPADVAEPVVSKARAGGR
jgi:LacI family transcriptional regulator